MALDTVNRTIDQGRRMRVWVGVDGPIAGVQAFEATATQAINRYGEYDSDEQIVDVQTPETNGFIEMLDTEKLDFYCALQGRDTSGDNDIVDADITNFGSPWIVANVWNKLRTQYTKSILVKKPVFTNNPFTTTLNDATTLRFEFAASRMVKLPHKAIQIDKFTSKVTAADGIQKLTLSGTALKLSRRFTTTAGVNSYVLGVAERQAKGTTPEEYDWVELDVTVATATEITCKHADGTAFAAGNTILAYYAVAPTVVSTTWPGDTRGATYVATA